jgi:hypothetical protein
VFEWKVIGEKGVEEKRRWFGQRRQVIAIEIAESVGGK